MTLTYHLHEVEPYINWAYFFHAWRTSEEQSPDLLADARRMLHDMEGRYRTHALVMLFEANSQGDDIILHSPFTVGRDTSRPYNPSPFTLPMLRQQHGDVCLCWADFLRPIDSGIRDKIGIYATTVDKEMEESHPDDDYQHMLAQTLADRLAEATAERLHEQVRRELWGYAPDERLTPEEMFQEKYVGRRPAVGYPSLPDQSLMFLIDEIIDLSSIGIRLTEHGAMRPHASTSGLMFAHPKARHFSIGHIGNDQIQDYARRRRLPETTIRKYLNL